MYLIRNLFFTFLIFSIFSFGNSIKAQDLDCLVKDTSLIGEYNGECKNGLAHGKGVAKGINIYSGNFKKGIPHKFGRYTWMSGDYYEGNFKNGKRNGFGKLVYTENRERKILEGYWNNDKYIGEFEKTSDMYQVIRSFNITRSQFVRTNTEGNHILIRFVSTVEVSNFSMMGSSGTSNDFQDYLEFRDVEYPFEGYIRYNSPNKANTGVFMKELKFKLLAKGNWEITIIN